MKFFSLLIVATAALVSAVAGEDTTSTVYSTIIHTVTIIDGSQILTVTNPTGTITATPAATITSSAQKTSSLANTVVSIKSLTTSANGIFKAALVTSNSTASYDNSTTTLSTSASLVSTTVVRTSTIASGSATASHSVSSSASGTHSAAVPSSSAPSNAAASLQHSAAVVGMAALAAFLA
jgi:hypothetical protein